jgi:hypothetical protein
LVIRPSSFVCEIKVSQRNVILKRIGIALVLGLVIAWGIAEASFVILREKSDHAPQRIELVIPAGTADKVAAGQAVPSIPADIVFVVGDTLVVKNEDSVSHQLGPIWVPPGTSASLNLDQVNDYSYTCSFQPSRNLGLDVRPRVTWTTRIVAVLLAGIPTGAMIAVYSFVVFPLRPKTKDPFAGQKTDIE